MVGGGLLMGVYVLAQALLGYFNARRHLAIENLALYTYVTAGAWVSTRKLGDAVVPAPATPCASRTPA